MMGMGGFNALQIILASGFPALTELGRIPVPVERLASLPEPVLLVRADERINFKLAANLSDPIRSDMAVLPLLVRVIPDVVVAPDYFLAGSRPRTFQLRFLGGAGVAFLARRPSALLPRRQRLRRAK